MKIAVASPCTVSGLAPGLPDYCDLDHPSGLIRSLVEAYAERGHQIEVFKFNRHADQVARFPGSPITVTLIPRRNRAIQLTPGQWRKERAAAVKAIQAAEPDVIHAHWTYEHARSALQTSLPSLITAHDVPSRLLPLMRPRYYWWPRLMQGYSIAKKARRMTAQSPYTLDCWKNEMNRTLPIDLVPNPIGKDVFALATNSRQPERASFAACSAGFHPRKNVKALLLAFKILRQSHPGATLRLFGDDYGSGEAAEIWANQNGLAEGVRFRGDTLRMKMLQEIAENCDAFVHPALEESFGMVVAEAMALRLPVVGGAESGAIPWLLDNGRAGILCDVDSPESISNAMVEALQRPELGQTGYERAAREFNLDTVADSYLKILKEEAERSTPAS